MRVSWLEERVEDEDVAAGGGDAPDFVAGGVFAKVGDVGADGNFGDGLEFGEIDDSERAVGGGDVGVHVEIGAEEGRTMFAEDDGDGGDEQDEQNEIGAGSFWRGTWNEKRIAEEVEEWASGEDWLRRHGEDKESVSAQSRS